MVSSTPPRRANASTPLSLLFTLLPLMCLTQIVPSATSSDLDGRYSFSLTTFSPPGHLPQITRATRASTLGTPVLALTTSDGIVLASPHSTPSPLINDDGTSRFALVTPSIVVTHSGVGADGRVVVAACQRLAVEYAYTFDEELPVEQFLEEVGSLMQEYTMKPGARPFGCAILAAHVPREGEGEPRLFRVDPSGAVEVLGRVGFLGRLDGAMEGTLLARVGDVTGGEGGLGRVADVKDTVLDVLRKELESSSPKTATEGGEGETDEPPKRPFLLASLTRKEGLIVRKVS